MRANIDPPLLRLAQWWDKRPAAAWIFACVSLLFICSLAFLWHLGSVGLVDETEPLFVEASRQMTITGDWITPYYNGKTRFDKPPLIYWLMASAFQVIGVNEWAARLPSALSAIALVVLGFLTLHRFGFPRPGHLHSDADRVEGEAAIADSEAGAEASPSKGSKSLLSTRLALWLSAWIGAALIALNPETIGWARMGVSDMLLSGCMGTALMAFFWGYAQPENPRAQTRWYFAFYVLTALAVLAKGPVGCVLPALIIGAFLLYTGQFWAIFREIRLIPGLLLFGLITIPWYVLVILENGQAYIDSFFGYHNYERFTRVVNGHDGPWYFYFVVVLVGFAPWSVYLPAAIARLRFWQVRAWRQQPRSTHLGLFALFWFGVIFSFFTISVTKLPSYVLPLMPAGGMLCGLFWSDHLTRPRRSKSLIASGIANLIFCIVLIGAALYSPNWMADDPSMPDLPEVVRQSNIMIWGAIVWGTVAIAGLILILRQQARWLWSVNLVGFLAFIVVTAMPAFFIMDAQRQLPLRQLAATIVEVQQPGEEVIMTGFEKPTMVFYTQRPITYIEAVEAIPGYLQSLQQETAPQSVLLVGRISKLEQAGLPTEQFERLQTAYTYELVRLPLSRP